jgi:membrane-associated protease RseP (regulator of RpoE activity)
MRFKTTWFSRTTPVQLRLNSFKHRLVRILTRGQSGFFELPPYPVVALALASFGAFAQTPDAERARQAAEQTEQAARTTAEQAELEARLATARAELAKQAREVAELSRQLGKGGPNLEVIRMMADPERGRIGVVLAPNAAGEVEIGAVTPGSPADRAGVRSGDVLVAVDGKPVTRGAGNPVERAGLGGLKRKQRVVLQLRGSDGQTRTVQLTAKAGPPPRVFTFGGGPMAISTVDPEAIEAQVRAAIEAAGAGGAMDPARIERIVERSIRHGDGKSMRMIRLGPGGRHGIELINLNPALGRYFSTSTGVLVASREGEQFAGLQPGDVLLEVAGQPVADARAAWRALYDQTPGSRFSVAIMRDQRRQSVELTGVERPKHRGPHPAPPAPPRPPEAPLPPPAPPAPPAGDMTAI